MDLMNEPKKIAKSCGFALGKEIYRAKYYDTGHIRNIIYEGKYKGRAAVLKIYDDPRVSDEPLSQIAYNKFNTSKIIVAPKVYDYKIISPNKGWLIMEKLPEGSFFISPVKDKKKFAELYLEYRLNFPLKPTRPLYLAENLNAACYHVFRINRWLELATAKEAELKLKGEKTLFRPKEFFPRFEKGMRLIKNEFKDRKMIWCHGHFKPHELFKAKGKEKYYLTDFAHSKMYPEGHELAFIIWADWIISADWRMGYGEWKKGIYEWIDILRPAAKALKINRFENLIKTGLVERIFGTILADIGASGRPMPEKKKRLDLCYKLFDDLV